MTGIAAHLLQISTGRARGSDIADLADAVEQFGSMVESELNKTIHVLRREMTGRCLDDCRGDVDAIKDCFAELVSLIRHTAEEARENDRQPLDRERAA